MPSLHVKTADGQQLELSAEDGSVLMETLRDNGLVEATCGGAASCGTCHIYFEKPNLAGEQTEDEGYMLESLEEFVEIRPGSRLSCQVNVSQELDGAHIEIAPEV